jgi:hypothetical protein
VQNSIITINYFKGAVQVMDHGPSFFIYIEVFIMGVAGISM